MTTLYDINENLSQLILEAQDFPEEEDTSIVDEWLARFTEAEGQRSEKLDAIMKFRASSLASALVVDIEIERLQNKKKKSLKLAGNMENMIARFMEMDNREEIKSDLFHAKWKKNPPAMVLSTELQRKKEESFNIIDLDTKLRESKSQFSEWKAELKKEAVKSFKSGEVQIEGVTIIQGRKLVIK